MDKVLVLVIEDERELNNILSEVLIMHNYDVVRAYNGQQAIDLIVKNNIKSQLDDNLMVHNSMKMNNLLKIKNSQKKD